MAWHIVGLAGPSDGYVPPLAADDHLLRVPFDSPRDPDAPQQQLSQVFAEHGIRPNTAVTDLLRAAIGAYAADVVAPRQQAYDGWSRDLVLHLPLAGPGWERGGPIFERLLRFLTGDHWRIVTRPSPSGYRSDWEGNALPRPDSERSVALFSGGLDSLIGAIDALGRGETPLFVGHYAGGEGATSVSQRKVRDHLVTRFGDGRIRFASCRLSIPKGRAGSTEATTRGRSILFLALGTLAAAGTGATRLLVPENGLISLNVPLTPARGGSLSTRTTHPHLIALYRQLLEALGIAVAVELPYRFATKGEMMRGCADQGFLATALADSISCAHPAAGRFLGVGGSQRHCGYCFPCLIRRAAIGVWGDDPTTYTFERLVGLSRGRRADLRALGLALARYEQQPPGLADLLAAGPLPGDVEEGQNYLGVFRRGLGELRGFFAASANEAGDAPH